MNILNVNISLDTELGGGTAERTYQMTRSLIKIGLDCKVLTLKLGGESKRIVELKQENVITLPCINKRFYIPKPSFNRVRNEVKNADIIHLMSHWALLNVVVYIAAKLYKKPYVICPAGALSYYGRSKKLKDIYNFVIGNKIIRDSTYCIAITKDEISDISSYGVNSSKIIHLPNGINEEEFSGTSDKDFRLKFGLTSAKIILFVGRLNLIKGVDLLLDAFCNIHHKIPDYQLVIAGPDEGMRKGLEDKISKFNLSDRIKIIGFLNSEYKKSAYQSSSLLVIPSRSEAMSIVVLEAGISGKAVLITDKCGFDEIEQINGGKVVEATTDGLEKGLLHILSNENKLKIMGTNLRDYVKQNYLWENIAKDHLDLFRTVAQTD